jgi:hypothetical protein
MKLFKDLYADMRDRRLLPLVGLLVVAILAVPFLLSSETELPPPSSATETAEVPEGIPTAAVMVSDPGLRDYRERLEDLNSKNPFGTDPIDVKNEAAKSQVESVTDAAADAGVADAATSAGGGSATPIEATVSEALDDSTTSSSITVNEGSGGGEGDNNGGGNGNGSDSDPVELAFRVDVETGQAGDVKRRKNVKLLTVLPSQANPVNLFLGASEDGKHAVFLVSEDVVTARGDGRCVPSPADCQFVNMKKGDEMRFEYAPNGGDADSFILRVLDIGLERNEATADSDRESLSSPVETLQAWLGI